MTEWQVVEAQKLCTDVVDCVNKTAPTVRHPTPYKMIRTTNVRGGWVDTSSVRYVGEETFHRWTRRLRPRKGDVILTREAPLGEVGILRSNDYIFLGQRLVMYRANPEVCDARFLAYAMLGPHVQDELRRLGSGATVEHLRVPDCASLAIPVPALPVQRTIAGVLGGLDDLIENNRRRVEVLEEMARAVYREWFVQFRYPGHENIPLVDSPLGPIPESWEVQRLGEIAELDRTSIQPVRSPSDSYDHYSIPAFDQGQLPLVDFGAAIKSGKFLVSAPSVLVSKLNPRIERTWFVQPGSQRLSVASTEFLVLRPTPGFTLEFLYLLARSAPFQERLRELSAGTSTSHQRAKPGDFLRIEVLTPPTALIDRLSAAVESNLRLSRALRAEGQRLAELRDLLLPKLVTGQIDASSLDLDSVLETGAA